FLFLLTSSFPSPRRASSPSVSLILFLLLHVLHPLPLPLFFFPPFFIPFRFFVSFPFPGFFRARFPNRSRGVL
ncbi:hypothetical protein, partial [Bifidobacterium merycicum]